MESDQVSLRFSGKQKRERQKFDSRRPLRTRRNFLTQEGPKCISLDPAHQLGCWRLVGHSLSSKHNRKKREEALEFALVDVIALRTLTELRGGKT